MRSDVVLGGKYRLLRPIGAGGMGSVWLARNENTEREFAIKFLHAHAAASPRMLQRFFQEARVSGKLRHPSILEIFDVGTAAELNDAPYLVMEHLDGLPLDSAIRRLGRLPVGIALEVVATIARATATAHDKGIIHRDLKPANVFLHRPGTGAVVPKVLDFGISKILSQPDSAATLGLTQTGAIMGSPLYMSPEQVEGVPTLDGRSDVYSMGVVLWECLSGKVPYQAQSYNLLVVEKLAAERPRLREVMPEVPASLDALVARVLTRDRARRIGTARELAELLDAERVALGYGAMLDRPSAAQWLFAQLNVLPSSPPPALEGESSTTTGAVSVPRPAASGPSSPIAYTMQSAQDPPSPFALTAPAPGESGERGAAPAARVTGGTTAQSAAARSAPPGSRVGPSRSARVRIGVSAIVVFAAAAFGAWRLALPSPGAGDVPGAASVKADVPAVAASPVPPAPSAPEAPGPAAAATAAIAAPSAHAAPSATPPAAVTKRRPPARPGGKADAGAAPPNRGIVDDGL